MAFLPYRLPVPAVLPHKVGVLSNVWNILRMSTRVYIGRLPYDCRERDIERFFKGFGRIQEILMKNGFAFVEFNDPRDADDAVYELNGKEILGMRVVLELARGPQHRGSGSSSRFGVRRRGSWLEKYGPPTRTEYRVIVENLSSRVSWQDLKDFMRQAGDVTYADAHKQNKNEGVVEFASYSDMKNAISKLDDTELSGRRIRIIESRPGRRSPRSRSSSRSRSRSRGRDSRSRSRTRGSRSRSRSVSKGRSRSRSMSRSRTPVKSRSRSPAKAASRSRSRSASPPLKKERASRSRSRSNRSPSPYGANSAGLNEMYNE
ncbi:hypothetical protein JTE90_017123 [Oedothorax gibbosus]|uniref:RRM domain-containing protein n=1 Tax=Oedothorax gibbosus TaxID=931172 RepID=A0AAV6UCB6_9ARAC|nr:hypothetical protein JTE90_017123 [Oedothorax gibbosus]